MEELGGSEVVRSRALVAEGVGTALLLAAGVGSGIMGERLAGGNVAIALLANTLATGAALVALIRCHVWPGACDLGSLPSFHRSIIQALRLPLPDSSGGALANVALWTGGELLYERLFRGGATARGPSCR